MKINIKATGIELTPAISSYVEKKLSVLEKFIDNPDVVAQVEVGKTTQHHKAGNIFRAEVHIIGAGRDIYAVSDQEDLYAAIDIVKDDIVGNIVHLKGKHETISRRSAQMMKNFMKGLSDGFRKFRKR